LQHPVAITTFPALNIRLIGSAEKTPQTTLSLRFRYRLSAEGQD
jgi:hypothetical protein